ncbi:SDR family NAD(P)-dependent oxidoreductase [Bacillus thuringiensis]|uniref:SDR family NAD(P)-dependent oxidoreductase n=1 Tax=Bacillus thuringiensis TaxID=1428 RepID=UPI003337818E
MDLNERSLERVLVIGGAGFIGSHIVDYLLKNNKQVTVFDNLSSGRLQLLKDHLNEQNFKFIQGDLTNVEEISAIMSGHDVVWHLGANADIARGVEDVSLDLRHNVIAMCNVLEAMRRNDVKNIMFVSTSAVYGNNGNHSYTETAGPLLPVSLYGAGKVSAETFISAYCNLFGIRGYIFRLGNVLGARMPRGILRDFILKLKNNPKELEVLGDGKQAKSFILVEDVIDGMVHVYNNAVLTAAKPCDVFNIAGPDSAGIEKIIDSVIKELGLTEVNVHYTGSNKGKPGDQTKVELNVNKVRELGWEAKYTSEQAINIATKRMINYLNTSTKVTAGGK